MVNMKMKTLNQEEVMEGDYKGKRVDNGEWACGYLMDKNVICQGTTYDDYVDIVAVNPVLVKPETVSQWTGLRDKNKKKIYYNDVLKGENGKYWVVRKGKLAIHLKCVKWRDDECDEEYDIITYSKLLKRGGREFEDYFIVVGNVHDNPEFRR